MIGFNAFKDLKIAYFSVAIPSTIILTFILGLSTENLFLSIIIPFLWALLFAIILTFIAIARINSTAKEMDYSCKADEFLMFYNKILENLKKPSYFVYLNLALGYLYKGDFEKAYCMIKLVDIKPEKNINYLTSLFSYYNALFCISHRLDKCEDAEAALNSMKNVLEKPELKFPYNSALSSIYFQNSIAFDIKFKNVELNEAYYLRLIDAEATLICKVVMNFTLAEHYYKKGNNEQAKQHYNFVAQNGGSTYYTGLAEERLKSI